VFVALSVACVRFDVVLLYISSWFIDACLVGFRVVITVIHHWYDVALARALRSPSHIIAWCSVQRSPLTISCVIVIAWLVERCGVYMALALPRPGGIFGSGEWLMGLFS
jgi:hypothetical protein